MPHILKTLEKLSNQQRNEKAYIVSDIYTEQE